MHNTANISKSPSPFMNKLHIQINLQTEPKEAFPYKPPTDEIKTMYAHIFELREPLPPRFFKTVFDKMVALVFLTIAAPILLMVKVAYLIEGWLIPENSGPFFFIIGRSVQESKSQNTKFV